MARRAWTREAADFLAANYRHGSGILFSFGDLTGVLREAGIPLREGLHVGQRPGVSRGGDAAGDCFFAKNGRWRFPATK